ncbi:hypothetical protein [Pontimicrobium sp. MEBiC06410]
MKKITFLILLVALVLSCSTDETNDSSQEVTQQVLPGQNPIKQALHSLDFWQTADLPVVFTDFIQEAQSFTFSKSFFVNSLEVRNLEAYRFALGVSNNKLQVICLGVTEENEVISSVFKIGTPNMGAINAEEVDTQQNTPYDVSTIAREDIRGHVLQIKDALRYLNDWRDTLNDISTLDDKVSYDGNRIKYYTLDKDAMDFLVNRDDVTAVELVFGLNDEGKMTTVFFGKNGKNVIFDTNAVNFALDFTSPCPSNCDDIRIN